jgi:hypothetical protein
MELAMPFEKHVVVKAALVFHNLPLEWLSMIHSTARRPAERLTSGVTPASVAAIPASLSLTRLLFGL